MAPKPFLTTSRQVSRPGLKMQELVAATGVPKSTILHYLHAGLLPAPVKTSRNMAYYDPACVPRITFIKLMQSRHRLPLKVIEKMLNEPQEVRELEPLLALRLAIFSRPPEEEFLDPAAFFQATGFSPQEVEDLERAGLLRPLEPGRFDQEDVILGRLLHRALKLGLTPADLAFYPRLAETVVDQEMALRQRLTAPLSLEEDAALTLELTQAARALRAYSIDREFQHRVMALKGLKDQGALPATPQ